MRGISGLVLAYILSGAISLHHLVIMTQPSLFLSPVHVGHPIFIYIPVFVCSSGVRVYTGLEGTVEKMSALLGRNAVYKKTSRLSRLPAYLTVQFVHFL